MSLRPLIKNNKFLVFLCLLVISLIDQISHKDVFTVTAYCNCKICINVRRFRDKRFASNEKTYFGGAAASKEIPFGTRLTLIPLNSIDSYAINKLLNGRKNFIVEDRGFLIKGRKIDVFIPDDMGGHKTAQKWGRRHMHVVLNPL